MPLWVNEGLSDFERGQWEPLDLMAVRDAAIADIIPKMTELEGYGGGGGPSRLIYNLGHAVFEFIEAKFGKEGIRQFLFSLRKSVIGGGEDAYEEALRMKKDEFDQNFEQYLKDRFKPFRDKERPADYGRDLSPNKEKTKFAEALSIAPSPSGDLIAVGHGQSQGSGAGHHPRVVEGRIDRPQPDRRLRQGPRLRSPRADGRRPGGQPVDGVVAQGRSARLLRPHREGAHADHPERADAQDRRADPDEDRWTSRSRRSFRPTASSVAFNALRNAVGDIFALNLETKAITNLTEDPFGDRAPSYSPDGKFIVYTARVSGNEKLFRLDLDTKKKTQITFGTQDETGGAVHRRSHDRLRVDGDRSGGAARARGRAQRQHPQHLDARSDEPASCASTPTRSAATGRRSS